MGTPAIVCLESMFMIRHRIDPILPGVKPGEGGGELPRLPADLNALDDRRPSLRAITSTGPVRRRRDAAEHLALVRTFGRLEPHAPSVRWAKPTRPDEE